MAARKLVQTVPDADLLVKCHFPDASSQTAEVTHELNSIYSSKLNFADVSWIYCLISGPVARNVFQSCFGLKGRV
jgi:hypothetical protein